MTCWNDGRASLLVAGKRRPFRGGLCCNGPRARNVLFPERSSGPQAMVGRRRLGTSSSAWGPPSRLYSGPLLSFRSGTPQTDRAQDIQHRRRAKVADVNLKVNPTRLLVVSQHLHECVECDRVEHRLLEVDGEGGTEELRIPPRHLLPGPVGIRINCDGDPRYLAHLSSTSFHPTMMVLSTIRSPCRRG